MSQTLQFTAPAQINSVKTLTDGTVKLDVAIAKELPADDMAILFEARKLGVGWFLFSPNKITEAAIPKEQAEASFEGKTPSQRMYNVLYVRWRELTNQSKPFDIYYQEQMSVLIDRLKQDLPERP
jgi:hypothetical protein